MYSTIFFHDFETDIKNKCYEFLGDHTQYIELKAERDNEFPPSQEHNIVVRCGAGIKFSAFILRLSWQITARDNRHTAIKVLLANLIKKHFQASNLNFNDYLRKSWQDNFNGQKNKFI